MEAKPRIFIASSVEGIPVAESVHCNLDYVCEPVPWHGGFYDLNISVLETLDEKINLDSCQFAVFVFTPDDVLKIRKKNKKSVRDNVLIELGFMCGRLGRNRCFVLIPRSCDNLRIPTDLHGIIPLSYNDKRSDKNLLSATIPPCREIKEMIGKIGRIGSPTKAIVQNAIDVKSA